MPRLDRITQKQFFIYVGVALLILLFCLKGDRWFPVVDAANLAFHEFGHPFFGAFSERFAVYGGTLGQLVFPAIVSFKFWRQKNTFSFSIGLLWILENFLNIARYIGDARAQELPLVGGGEHDWTEILSRWNALHNDIKISSGLVKLTVSIMVVYGCWLYSKISRESRAVE